ncbi:phytanoyl-CoA dioxygenase family protein [Azohydromonas australica]|uniref:phytanoyl-CoA dioxygenase family protein n=1 Tax=Azohydromonas australica TaxID=364039 RepID=UPI000409540D|nr:phytanoyl-CoA dioxygenase family protein [Azohydromonas australica]
MTHQSAKALGALRTAFRDDGVVYVPQALDAAAMALAEKAFAWSLHHPGPGASNVLAGRTGEFYQDHANPLALSAYRPLLFDTPLSALVAELLDSRHLWLLYEQIWLKDGGDTLRTPWHQDLPYVPLAGDHLATAWINLDPVVRERSLEFVRGSHRGPLYNPTAFDPDDPKAVMYGEGTWPALPDVDAERLVWPIESWPIVPGDVVIFHPAVLHGGAPTCGGARRRTISLRFFGDRAYCAARPQEGLAPEDQLAVGRPGWDDPMIEMARRPPGSLFRHPAFMQLC